MMRLRNAVRAALRRPSVRLDRTAPGDLTELWLRSLLVNVRPPSSYVVGGA